MATIRQLIKGIEEDTDKISETDVEELDELKEIEHDLKELIKLEKAEHVSTAPAFIKITFGEPTTR